MSKITYANKEAIIENADIPITGKVTDDDMNEIKRVVNENETKILLAVDSVAPEECSTGDMYYNTTDNLIYTATATNTWSSTGTIPTLNTIYVDFFTQSTYVYNGTTLISVGGGAGGGGDSTPIGTIQEYAGSTAPDGYLMCDGSAVSRTTYKDLFNVIGTTYGSGDGSTTFNLPNIKGRVVVMLDSNDTDFDTLGETGGEKTHTLTLDELPRQVFTFDGGNTGNFSTQYVGTSGNAKGDIITQQALNNLQPYIVLNKIIKVQKTAGEVLSEQLPVGTEVDFDGSASDIPIGWEQVESYSTSEVKIGDTWIDGKPIYRKVIKITSGISTGTTITTNISDLNIDKCINIKGFTYSSTFGYVPIDFYNGSNYNYAHTGGGSGFNNIYWRIDIGASEVYFILEYTKTTD
jgi:microcystin-dependent protein